MSENEGKSMGELERRLERILATELVPDKAIYELLEEMWSEFPSCEVCSVAILPNPAKACYDAYTQYPSKCPKDIWKSKWSWQL